MGPLFACYDLRVADAHLPSSVVEERLSLLGVAQGMNAVEQGKQIIRAVAETVATIGKALENISTVEP